MKFRKISLLALTALITLSFQSYGQSLEEGLKHLSAERYKTAGVVFESLAQSNPTAENLYELGHYYLSSPDVKQNLDKATAAFEKANATEKKGLALAQIGLGTVQLAKGDYAGAKAAFAAAVEGRRESKDPENFYRIAEAYTLFDWANDPAEAIINIDKALELKEVKDNPYYYIVKSNAYLIKNEGGDVMNALQNAERIAKFDKANIYAKMARVWLQGKNYKEAQDAINKSIAEDKTHAPAYRYQSSYYQTYQQWEKSAEAARLYLQNSDGDCGAKLRYAQIAFISKDFESVLGTLKEIETCNTLPIVYRLGGISQFELTKYSMAIPLLEKYIEVAPKEEIYGLDYGFLGRSYFLLPDEATKAENQKKGIELMEKAISMGDTTFSYYGFLSDYYKEAKDYPAATQFLEKAIAIKKKPDAQDYANLGILQYQIRDYKKADATFDNVVEAYKKAWPQAYAISAKLKTLSNPTDSLYSYAYRYEEYLDALGEEGRLKGGNEVTEALRYLAGKEFAVNKDIPKANTFLDEILGYDPENAEIKALRNQINGVVEEVAPIPAPGSGNK